MSRGEPVRGDDAVTAPTLRPAPSFEIGKPLLDGGEWVQPAGERSEGGRRSCESLAHVVAQVAEVALGRHLGAHLAEEPQDHVVSLVAHASKATTLAPEEGRR
jgi:hypothetical protein